MTNQFLADFPGIVGRLRGKRHRKIAKSDPKGPPTAPTVNQNAPLPTKKLAQKQKMAQDLVHHLCFTRLLLILLLFGFAALRLPTLRHNNGK